MGRYVKDIQLDQPIDVVSVVMDDFVYHNRFSRADWNGEMVYYLKDRHDRERYMKWYYVDGVFHVEAWLKNPFGDEMDLDGVGGGASRKEYRKSIEELLETLKKQSPSSLAGGHVGSDPLHHEGAHEENHEAWKADTQWQRGAGDGSRESVRGSVPVSGGKPGDFVHRNRRGNLTQEKKGRLCVLCAVCALFMAWGFPVFGIIFAAFALKWSKGCPHSRLVMCVAVIAICEAVMGLAIGIMGAFMFNFIRGGL